VDLFLDAEGIARYERFAERFDERPMLLARLRLPETPATASDTRRAPGPSLSAALDEAIALARPLGVELVTSRDLDAGTTPGSATEPLLPFRGPGHEAFLAVLPRGGEESAGVPLVTGLISLAERLEVGVDLAGVPYTRYELDRASAAIGGRLFPLVFALGFIVILALLRDPVSATILYAPALISTGIALATIRELHGAMDMVSAIVPLLVFVLTLCLAFHLRAASIALGSFRLGLVEKARPIGQMVITTATGFGTLVLSEIESIRRFGFLCAILVVATSLVTVAWMAIAAPMLRTRASHSAGLRGAAARAALWRPSLGVVCLSIAACVAAGFVGLRSLPIQTDALEYFPESSGIAARVRSLQREVLGAPIIEIAAVPPDGGEVLAELDRATRAVEGSVASDCRVISRSSLLREARRALDGSTALPENAVAEMLLWRAIPAPLRAAYGRPGVERITVFGPSTGASEQRAAVERLDPALARAAPGWSFSYEGMVHELLGAQEALIRALGLSFAASLIVIATLFWLSYRSVRLLGVFLLANVVPIGGGYALAALLGFSLNVATVMVASVALGMVVDSTLHLIHALSRAGSGPEARGFHLRSTIEPVLASAAVLIPCFLAFGAFEFVPIREFGVTLGATIGLALLFDLYAVPVLFEFSGGRARPPGDLAGAGDPGTPSATSDCDAVVVGAGSAGLAFAARLAELGRSVVVLEADAELRRPVCGEYLCPSGVTVIRELGWDDLLEGCPPIRGMMLASPAGRIVTGDFPDDGAHGDGCSVDKRRFLGALLARAERAGARVRFSSRVEAMHLERAGWRVRLSGGEEIAAPLLIGADGRRSIVARSLGLAVEPDGNRASQRVAVRGFVTPLSPPERRGEMHLFSDGSYIGMNPISDEEVNASICLDRERLRELGGPAGAFRTLVGDSARLSARYDWATLRDVRGAYPIRHRVRSPIARRAALIGDAGGFLDPLTGEGMSIAIWTGSMLADLVAGPLGRGGERDLSLALRTFARRKRARLGAKRILSLALQGVIRRPWLCEAIARGLAGSPERTRAFLGAIGNHYTPISAALRIGLASRRRSPSPPDALDLGPQGGLP